MSSILIGFVSGFAVMYLIALLVVLVVTTALLRSGKTEVYGEDCPNMGACDGCDLKDDC